MADIFVVISSTLWILFLSYFFWKWHTRRNNFTSENSKKPAISREDMLKNRLKRFDLKGVDASSKDTVKESQITGPKGKEESFNVSEDLGDIDDENQGLEPEFETASKSSDVKNTDNSPTKSDTDSLREGFSASEREVTKTKHENPRKWVTLSMTDNEASLGPVTCPLKNLEELWSWTEGFDELSVSSVPLQRVTNNLEQRPRTLVCHDMKGGYVQDRFVQGYPSTNCYRIYHWQYIDIFVYFSHNFITIPPPCWTNAAHKHGVLVLGTFITEWEDGARRCADIFKDKISYRQVADQLVLIAKYYGFEGWLINIENPIQPAQMNNLVDFLKYVTDQMHKAVPGSLIIWYDSVTYKGELKWQNKLNSENRVFFDVSDGIFLNYGWNQTDLALSGRGAGTERQYDVYVGVDVFGRGVFGGGGWNTNKATHVIKNNNLSMALFAPGWVYEKYESTFKASQDKFWTSVAPDCTAHGLGPCLPFVTSFCQGYGEKWFTNGKVVFDHSWTHLSAQQLQPSYINQIYNLGNQNGVLITSIEHQMQEAYLGGGCLLLQGSSKSTTTLSKAVVRLFRTDILLPSTVLISFTIKVDASSSLDVALQLHVDKKPNYIMLCPAMLKEKHSKDSEKLDSVNEALVKRYGVPRSDLVDSERSASLSVGQEHYRSFVPLTGDYHDTLAEMCCDVEENADSLWCTRYYLLAEKDLKGSRIKEIRLVLMNKTIASSKTESSSIPFQLYLGEVKIIEAVSLRRPLPTASSLKCLESDVKSRELDSNTRAITLTLSWNYDSSTTEPWERFYVYHLAADGSPVFLGLAFALSFVVSELAIPRSQKETQFTVQAISCCQRKQALRDCPTITVHWS